MTFLCYFKHVLQILKIAAVYLHFRYPGKNITKEFPRLLAKWVPTVNQWHNRQLILGSVSPFTGAINLAPDRAL